MRIYTYLLIFIAASFHTVYAQDRKFKCEKIHDAVKLVDQGKYEEGITILKECEKTDPKDYVYPYEIAYAYSEKGNYKEAISQLEKIKNYPDIQDDYYVLLGNNYDYLDNPEQAIKVYNEGLKKFPSSGKLYLEKGVVYELQKKYSQAVQSYENGMKAAPSHPSNYYRASKLYLNSSDPFAGLIYGEIFVNLERTTPRTKEISKLLYEGYKKAVKINSDSIKVDFCKNITIDIQKFKNDGKFPFCVTFGKHFSISILDFKEINLNTLSSIRRRFLKEFYLKDSKDYPNLLIAYHKTMEDHNVFEAYNHYIFQMGDQEAFKLWMKDHEPEYNRFTDWYTQNENILKVTKENLYIDNETAK